MSLNSRIMDGLVGAAKTYRGASLHVHKALPQNHEMGSKRWPSDLSTGNYAAGNVVCQDAFFSAKFDQDNHPTPGTAIADNEKILMGFWEPGARLRSVEFKKTVAWSTPADQSDADYFANVEAEYFTEAAVAAFPPFTLWAEHPTNSAFKPFLLITEAETTGAGNEEGVIRPLSALAYGANKEREPLLIVAQARGAVPDESGLFLHITTTKPHV